MSNIGAFSCITGNLDTLKEDQPFDEADFYLFTDTTPLITRWTTLPIKIHDKDPRREARHIKLTSHRLFPDYDYTIWVDGNVTIKRSIQSLIDEMGDADMLTFYHPERNTVKAEAQQCNILNLDFPGVIDTHYRRMVDDGFPDESGLAETKIVVRKNNEKVREFNELWLSQLTTGTLRDQISFPYCVWKTGIKVKYIKPISKGNTDFVMVKHPRRNYSLC